MLITVRHGTTNFNEARVFSGHGDEPRLTNKALNEAYELGKELLKYHIDIAAVSPLTRAKQTFNEINKTINVSSVIMDNLKERDFKEYEGKPLTSIDKSIYWNMDKSHIYDIEDINDFVARIEKSLNDLKEKYKDKNVLIVAHSGVCRAIKYIVEGKVNRKWYVYDMNNLQANVFTNW